jgi:ribosomal protein S20
MKKLIAGGAMAAAVVGGSLGLALLNPLGVAGARTYQVDPGSSTTAPPAGTPADPGRPGPGQPGANRDGRLDEVLKGLVDDGTLTQAQADKVKERLKAAGPKAGGPGRGGPGGHVGLDHKAGLEAAAGAIGIGVDDLRAALQSGRSMAEVAQEHGVDPQKVIDALTAEATKRIDQAVTDGKLTQEQADKAKSRLGEAIPKMVNGKPGDGGGHGHGPRGPGRGGPGAPQSPPTTQGG